MEYIILSAICSEELFCTSSSLRESELFLGRAMRSNPCCTAGRQRYLKHLTRMTNWPSTWYQHPILGTKNPLWWVSFSLSLTYDGITIEWGIRKNTIPFIRTELIFWFEWQCLLELIKAEVQVCCKEPPFCSCAASLWAGRLVGEPRTWGFREGIPQFLLKGFQLARNLKIAPHWLHYPASL